MRELELRGGLKQRAWYDIPRRAGSRRTKDVLEGYDESLAYGIKVLNDVFSNSAGRPVHLVGFGQGGALAASLALGSESRQLTRLPDGLLLFGSYLIAGDKWNEDALKRVRIQWAHSNNDKQVSYRGARMQFDDLRKRGASMASFIPLAESSPREPELYEEAMGAMLDFVAIPRQYIGALL